MIDLLMLSQRYNNILNKKTLFENLLKNIYFCLQITGITQYKNLWTQK